MEMISFRIYSIPVCFSSFVAFNRNSYLRYNHKNIKVYQSGILIDNTGPQVTGVLTPVVFHSPRNHIVDCRLPFRKWRF